MKTQYILPALFVLGTTLASTQAIATGMTYDPYENYYSEFYGIGAETSTKSATTQKSDFYDPYENYYNTYYGIDGLLAEDEAKATAEASPSFADPLNYYNW